MMPATAGSSGASTTSTTASSGSGSSNGSNPPISFDSIVGDDAYSQVEQTENGALHVPALPAEMLVKIMEKLDTPDLVRGTMRVCKRWNLISKQVLLDQIREIDEQQLWIKKDLRAYLHALHPEAVASQLANSANTSTSAQYLQQMQHVKLLMFYHRTHFDCHDEIGLQWDSVRNIMQEEEISELDKSFLRGLTRAYSREYRHRLSFMPCHNLILLPTDENLKFFAESPDAATASTSSSGKRSDTPQNFCMWNEYAASAQNKSAPSNIADRVSVHEDIILATGDTRKSVLYIRVVKVDHQNQTVVLNFMREIFTPFYINASLYFNGKIYIQYGNSPYIGMWKESSDILDLSETGAGVSADGDAGSNWSICRMCNIIFFVPPLRPLRQLNTTSTWKCLDGNYDHMQLHDVEMSTLVLSIQPNLRDRRYGIVSAVYAFNNIFIAICLPLPGTGSETLSSSPAIAPMLVLASVMKHQPNVGDFTSVDRFRSLFYLRKTKTLKLMGNFRSELFYFLNGINLLGEDDGGAFLLRVQKTFISET